MSSPQRLVVIDRLCSREFPAGHGGSDVGYSGPGYHVAVFEPARPVLGDAPDAADRHPDADQCVSEFDALSAELETRWGPAEPVSLDGVLLRFADRDDEGDEPDEPWASVSEQVAHVHLWHLPTANRWLALGTSRPHPEHPSLLLAVIAEAGPP